MSFLKDPRNDPASKEVVDALKKSGSDAEGFTLYSYAAVQAVAAALAANKDETDGTKLADWLKANPVPTVTGNKAGMKRVTSNPTTSCCMSGTKTAST